MAQFFAEYGLFLLKVVTIVAGIVVILITAASVGRRGHEETLEVDNLNDKYKKLGDALLGAVSSKSDRKKAAKASKKEAKAKSKDPTSRPRSFVIDFKGDLKASAVPSLREEVNAILDVAGGDDEVIVRLENHGGVVHEHGLAASQLARIREHDIPLIACVDKVAASGGYLMACVASRIYVAPFAILGSIGVLAQIPNFNRMLDTHGVDFEQITAGKHKRTVTMFGKNTDEDRAKLKEELEDVHWYGKRALELGLADEILTSDELLKAKATERDLYHVVYKIKQPLQKRVFANIDGLLEKAEASGWRRRFESRLPR